MTEFPIAGLERRFYAFVIDRGVAWAIDGAAAFAAYRYLIEPGQVLAGTLVIAGTVLVVGGLSAVLLGLTGLTPGNAALGVRVVRDGTGTPIGVGRAVLRQLVLGVAALPTLGLAVSMLAWTAVMDPSGRRRGWHDKVARSVVLDVRPLDEDAPEPDSGPRHVVNLTALRLVPAPAPAQVAPPRAPKPSTPPPGYEPEPRTPVPAGAPAPVAPESTPESTPEPMPEAAPAHRAPAPAVPAARASARQRQQLGYPLVPESRPDAAAPTSAPASAPAARPSGGAHAARPAAAEAPARWRVSFDTGESFVVEGLMLIGRRPEARRGEQAHRLVPLASQDMSLSKTHAQVQVTPDGSLVVMDRGSTNGSVLVRQGTPRDLSVGRAATLINGDVVRFGDRSMTVAREA